MGFTPICLIPTATVSPGPNFPDLAKHFPHVVTHILQRFCITEPSIEDSKCCDRNGWTCLGTSGPWDRSLACPLRR
jgi:hypothetical protein